MTAPPRSGHRPMHTDTIPPRQSSMSPGSNGSVQSGRRVTAASF
jgi:hypothetical protein